MPGFPKALSTIILTRENGEISSEMTDEQIAKLLIYTGNGVNVSKVSSNDVAKIEKELKFLWDCLYNLIKIG
jgi:hypothetical protein